MMDTTIEKKTKYGIVGSRSRTDKKSVVDFVNSLPAGSVVVSGGCRGVDQWAIDAARAMGLETVVFLPDLAGCEKRHEFTKAYYARNERIAAACDILVAFVSEDRKGGTEDTIKRAWRHGKDVWTK